MWANLGQIKEMYSNEVYDIIIIVMIVIILWLWNMKWWVSDLKRGVQTPWTPPPLDLSLSYTSLPFIVADQLFISFYS